MKELIEQLKKDKELSKLVDEYIDLLRDFKNLATRGTEISWYDYFASKKHKTAVTPHELKALIYDKQDEIKYKITEFIEDTIFTELTEQLIAKMFIL